MPAKDEFVLYLEKNPQFGEIVKSSIHIAIMRKLGDIALDIDKLSYSFSGVERGDMQIIINVLQELKLVSKTLIARKWMYFLSETGTELLNIYDRTKGGFSIE